MKNILRQLTLTVIVLGLLTSARAATEIYVIDSVHSSVGFGIRHFFSKVPGSFTKFAGAIVVDRENLENSTVEATIDIGSVSTANEKRDNHLRSPDFLMPPSSPPSPSRAAVGKRPGMTPMMSPAISQ